MIVLYNWRAIWFVQATYHAQRTVLNIYVHSTIKKRNTLKLFDVQNENSIALFYLIMDFYRMSKKTEIAKTWQILK